MIFKWLKNLFVNNNNYCFNAYELRRAEHLLSCDVCMELLYLRHPIKRLRDVNLHIDGLIVIKNEDRQRHTTGIVQGPINASTSAKDAKGSTGDDKRAEEHIGPEFFASTGPTKVSFGTEVEQNTKKTPKQDHKISP
jgi:hypothetical protein